MFKAWIHVVLVLSIVTGLAAAQESEPPRRSFPPGSVPSSRARPQTNVAPATSSAAPQEGAASQPQMLAPRFVPAATAGTAEPVSVLSTKDAAKYRREVYRLRAVPASELARTIEQVFRAEGKVVLKGVSPQQAVIVPDVMGNNLILSGPPEAVQEMGQLIEKLDHPPAMLRLEVVIAEGPSAAGSLPARASGHKAEPASKSAGQRLQRVPTPEQMEVLFRGEFSVLDNQPAHLQMGRRQARVISRTFTSAGMTNATTLDNVGTLVSVTPGVAPDKSVTLKLDVEDSRVGPAEEGVPVSISKDGETIRSPNIDTLVCQTSVRIADGETLTLAGMVRQTGSAKQRFILITPHVLPLGGEGR